MQLHRWEWLVRLKLIELNEITIADRAYDLASAIVLMISTVENQEHADDRVYYCVQDRFFVAQFGSFYPDRPEIGI